MDSQCNQDQHFHDFRITCRQLGLPLGLIASSRRVEQQINVMHHFMWKNAMKMFPTLTASLPSPSQTIPHPFKVKTEKGIETRSSYLASDFVYVVSLLAEELSKFLDHWRNVPTFVEEEVSKSAKLLLNELEVLSCHFIAFLIFILQAVSRQMFPNQSSALRRRNRTKIPT